jgi:hypothetical protein
MVSKINNQEQALEILTNTTASHFVKDLKKEMGTLTFIFKKYCPCFFKAAKLKIKNAEIKDKLPAEIQKTAAKVIELAQAKFTPAIIEDRVKNNEANSVAVGRRHKNTDITAAERVNASIEELSSKVITLANAYSHDLTSVTAFIGGMNELLQTKAKAKDLGDTFAETLTGISFTGIHAIRAEAKQFAANNDVEAIISGFDEFIGAMQQVSPNHKDLISAHIQKTLAESVGSKFTTYLTSYNKDAAAAKRRELVQAADAQGDEAITSRELALAEVRTDADHALREPQAQLTKHVERASALRGTTGFNGLVHEAWLSYMKSISQFILAMNENVSGDGKLSDAEVAQLNTIISNRDSLKEAEAFLNGILSRPNFGRTNLALFTAEEVLRGLNVPKVRHTQTAVSIFKADFEKLRDELNSLTGKGQNMSLNGGQYRVTADSAIGQFQEQIRSINEEREKNVAAAELSIHEAKAHKPELIATAERNADLVQAQFEEKSARAQKFFAKLERVKEALRPRDLENPNAFDFSAALRS